MLLKSDRVATDSPEHLSHSNRAAVNIVIADEHHPWDQLNWKLATP